MPSLFLPPRSKTESLLAKDPSMFISCSSALFFNDLPSSWLEANMLSNKVEAFFFEGRFLKVLTIVQTLLIESTHYISMVFCVHLLFL